MSSILLLAALNFRGRAEALGPSGFLARTGPISLWILDFSDSSFRRLRDDFWRAGEKMSPIPTQARPRMPGAILGHMKLYH